MKFLLLVLPLLSHASLRDPGEIPGPRFRCDQAKVNACQSEHQNLERVERAAAASLEAKIALFTDDKSVLSKRAAALAAEGKSFEASLLMARLEQEFTPMKLQEEPLFSGGPGPGEILLLAGAPLFWSELHGDSRRARLREESDRHLARKSETLSQLDGISRQISDLEQTIQALRSASDGHLRAANAHASMCREGCKTRFCPDL